MIERRKADLPPPPVRPRSIAVEKEETEEDAAKSPRKTAKEAFDQNWG